MAREIKFRVFYKDSDGVNKMSYNWAFEEYAPVNDQLNSVVNLMQYTGLNDSNGTNIYEGDILSYMSKNIGPYWIIFENGSFVCYHKHGKWGLLSRIFEADILQNYSAEIIGNIYENPELLNQPINQ